MSLRDLYLCGIIIEVDRCEALAGVNSNEVSECLNTYSDEMLETIHSVVMSRGRFIRQARYRIIDIVSVLGLGMTEAKLNQLLWLSTHLDTDLGFNATISNGLSMNEGLAFYEDYSVSPESVQRQCIALSKVLATMLTCAAKGAPVKHDFVNPVFPNRWISDSRITAMILDSPDIADMAIETIEKHGRADYGLMEAIFNNDSLPLSEGVL